MLVRVDADEMIAEETAAAACSWSFADFSASTTFVRFGMTGVFLANERLSSFRPPGSSKTKKKQAEISDLWVNWIEMNSFAI